MSYSAANSLYEFDTTIWRRSLKDSLCNYVRKDSVPQELRNACQKYGGVTNFFNVKSPDYCLGK